VISGAPLDQALAQVEEIVRPGDVLLTVGAGDVDRLAAAWLGGAS
jgi:UDP-N-acetylmuramate-alanine ligase